MKYIEVEKLITEIERLYAEHSSRYELDEAAIVLDELENFIDSLQQEQPEVDLEKEIEFICINKRVKMTIQELINYYIDTECADTADECNF